MSTRKTMMLGVAASVIASRSSVTAGERARTSVVMKAGSLSSRIALADALRRPNTLAYHAARAGMLFGTFIDWPAIEDPAYMRVVRRECSLINAWGLAPNITRRSRNGFDFSKANELLALARASGQAVCGGYLADHGNEPPWMMPDTKRAPALEELQRIVTTTMTHFSGQLEYWIVANEAIVQDGMRGCTWLTAIGPDYVAQAFTAARAADRSATLVYSDFGLEDSDEESTRKRAAVLALLQQLRRDNVPIDALGLQGHLRGDTAFSASGLQGFLDSVRALEMKVVVTELDVNDARLPADIGVRDEAVKRKLSAFLDVVLNHPAVISINAWGISDNHSWYNEASTPASLRRADGLLSRSTPLDLNLKRKPAYSALAAALGEV